MEPGAGQNIDRTIKGSLCGAWSRSEYSQSYQGFSLGEPGAGQNIDRTIKGSLFGAWSWSEYRQNCQGFCLWSLELVRI